MEKRKRHSVKYWWKTWYIMNITLCFIMTGSGEHKIQVFHFQFSPCSCLFSPSILSDVNSAFKNHHFFIALFSQVLMPQSVLLSLSLYSGFSILGIVTVFLLPIETKGRALQVRKIITDHYVWHVLTTRQQKYARLSSNHLGVLGYPEINGSIFIYPYLYLVQKWGPGYILVTVLKMHMIVNPVVKMRLHPTAQLH